MSRSAEEVLLLLDEHGARLHALLLRLTLRPDVAEDLLQDLFCKLVASDRFRAADNAAAYAIRMATNLAFDHRRARRREAQRGTDAAEAISLIAADERSPLADLVRREELEQTLDALGRLPTAAREIIVLRYLEREEFESIGRQLGKTPHQARALCHKAIKRLRMLLDTERAARSAPRRPEA